MPSACSTFALLRVFALQSSVECRTALLVGREQVRMMRTSCRVEVLARGYMGG